ncbi:TBC1 domain family member 23-like [Rhopilema esculentum]|uniref:TBC1 domain family member 23-like n=1 Tax=Rhopilema esculentum TaxID=499914 RepID=UPI0031E2595A
MAENGHSEKGGDEIEDIAWRTDLLLCLSKQPDVERLRELCKGKKIPSRMRPELWKALLNIAGKPDAISTWDGVLDLNEQDVLSEDCRFQAAKLRITEEDEEEVARDMEGLITFYCKSRNEKYRTTSGLIELLSPFITLKLPLSDVYNCFYAMHSKYIPRECYRDGKPFSLFRQILQYHDPLLCSFLDSRKIPPDLYGQKWLRSLFASVCDSDVIQAMWDAYLLDGDSFFVFFLMLVMVLNAKERILEMSKKNKSAIIDMITAFPQDLGADDIEDFCILARYYSTRTPQSFRKDFQPVLFGSKIANPETSYSSLCLQISAAEVMESYKNQDEDAVHYFLVDCRPADQYNNGHLPTAFHLDANLMLQAPDEFSTAVQALFSSQQQAMEAKSVAGGEHLCFMGSGREAEDQYVNMVIANFLQRGTHFVGIVRGGYTAIHDILIDDLTNGLADHNLQRCIVCTPEAISSEDESHELSRGDHSPTSPKNTLVERLSTTLKSRGANMKERLGKLMESSARAPERHVSASDRTGKRYRNVNLDIFSIGDDEDEPISSEDEGRKEAVNVTTWTKRNDVVATFPCSEITESGHMYSSYILLTLTNLFILREIIDRPGWAHILSRPHLTSIVKITSKRKHPQLITFKYGTSNGESYQITATQRFLIPDAKNATKKIKERIVKIIGD